MSTAKAEWRRRAALAFGAALRAARLARGISQEKLAALGDFDRTYPSLLERGLRTPTFTVILRLAEALEIDSVRLFASAVARLHGEDTNVNRRVYRLAHREPAGEFTQVGRAYLSIDDAGRGATQQNGIRKEFGLRELTHAAIYEQIDITEVTKPPL